MAKKAKRREWTKDDVRELKTLARQKTPVARIAKSLKQPLEQRSRRRFRLACHWTRADRPLQSLVRMRDLRRQEGQ